MFFGFNGRIEGSNGQLSGLGIIGYDTACVNQFKADLGDNFSWRKQEGSETTPDADADIEPDTEPEQESEEVKETLGISSDSENVNVKPAATIIPIILSCMVAACIVFLCYCFYKNDPERFKNTMCKCCRKKAMPRSQ